MGVIFELVINFGDVADVGQGVDRLLVDTPVRLRGLDLCVAPAFVSRVRTAEMSYSEVSIHPRGVSYHGPEPTLPFDIQSITDEELSAVGHQLYDVLRRMDGYLAASSVGTPSRSSTSRNSPTSGSRTAASTTCKVSSSRTRSQEAGSWASASSRSVPGIDGCRTKAVDCPDTVRDPD